MVSVLSVIIVVHFFFFLRGYIIWYIKIGFNYLRDDEIFN